MPHTCVRMLICLGLLQFIAVIGEAADPGNPLTTHVLDVSKGLPGRNIQISLHKMRKMVWIPVKSGTTNADGRLGHFLPQARFTRGVYKMTFHLADYFKKEGKDYFHPQAEITFRIKDPNQHYHIPLLVSPYSYTTYRGS